MIPPERDSAGSAEFHERSPRPEVGQGLLNLLLPKSSRPGSRRQNRPDLRQQFLNRALLPHGQRSFRPSFSSSSLSPRMMRTPRLTCVSEGNPFRRLLIVSKKWLFVVVVVSHGAPPFVERISRIDTGRGKRFGAPPSPTLGATLRVSAFVAPQLSSPVPMTAAALGRLARTPFSSRRPWETGPTLAAPTPRFLITAGPTIRVHGFGSSFKDFRKSSVFCSVSK